MNGGDHPILRRVRVLIDARRYDEALLDLGLAPESAETVNLTGLIALKRRRYRQAEQHLRRALELDPEHYEAANNLGLAISAQPGRRREAVEVFARAAELNPEDPVGAQNLTASSRHWVYGAALAASWVILRTVRTAWISGNWQGLWNPWAVGAWSVVVVAAAALAVRRRRRRLPQRALQALDRSAAAARRAKVRNGIFDGALFTGFFGGMWWAIERYEVLQRSMGLRAVVFLALLLTGVGVAILFRRITGSTAS